MQGAFVELDHKQEKRKPKRQETPAVIEAVWVVVAVPVVSGLASAGYSDEDSMPSLIHCVQDQPRCMLPSGIIPITWFHSGPASPEPLSTAAHSGPEAAWSVSLRTHPVTS